MYAGKILHIIVAFDEKGTIGGNNQLLWHIPDDLKRFKRLTWGHAIIMGRKTHESIGRVLPGRQNIVLSRTACGPVVPPEAADWTHPVWVRDWDAAVAAASTETVFIIGGASIYRLALPYADTVHVTHVHGVYAGDTFFPELSGHVFACTEEETPTGDYTFKTYVRLEGVR